MQEEYLKEINYLYFATTIVFALTSRISPYFVTILMLASRGAMGAQDTQNLRDSLVGSVTAIRYAIAIKIITCKKYPLDALIRTRVEFAFSLTIWKVAESVEEFVTATALIPSNPTNCWLNTLNLKVSLFSLHNCTNIKAY
jgi:hypothetical protein